MLVKHFLISWVVLLKIFLLFLVNDSSFQSSIVLYSLTRATLMSLGRTKHVSVDIYAVKLFIQHSGEHWWEQSIFRLFNANILAKLSTWCLGHSGDISRSLLVNPSHTYIYITYNIYIYIYIYMYIYRFCWLGNV